jgi:acyl-CoA synthetase (NDP forming)
VEKVTPLLPPHGIKTNPIDLTGDATAKMFAEVMNATRDHYDTLGVIFGDPVLDVSQVVTPGANELIVFLGGAEVERRERELMHLKGVPVFPTPERGVRALARVIGRKGLAPPKRPTALADSPKAASRFARVHGLPVALKISSPDIVHKSDVGGVRLNLTSIKAVERSYGEILGAARNAFPEAQLDGVLVSKMAAPGVEVIVGMNRDPQFGPIMLFGLGGVLVELFRDVSLRPLPLSQDEAHGMIREIRGYRLLAGYRGKLAVNEDALADCILQVAEMAVAHQEILEIDLNPVFAYPDGIMVVDARIIVQ